MMNNLTLQDLLLKEFKFQQTLRVKFMKNDQVFKNKACTELWFH